MVRGGSKLWPACRQLVGRECDQLARNGARGITEQEALGYHSLAATAGASFAATKSLKSSGVPGFAAVLPEIEKRSVRVDSQRRFSLDAEATDVEHKLPEIKYPSEPPSPAGEISATDGHSVSPLGVGASFKLGDETGTRSGGWSAAQGRGFDAQGHGGRVSQFPGKTQPTARNDRYMRARNNSSVANVIRLLEAAQNQNEVEKIMEQQVPDSGVASRWPWLPLLEALQRGPKPYLALEVFNWKRNKFGGGDPREYAKLISMAGRLNQLEVAVDLFKEMEEKGVKRLPITCNALMSAFSKNGQVDEAVAILKQMSEDPDCKPTLVTYNTLISMFSKSEVGEMEKYYDLSRQAGFLPDRVTFNSLIWGYMRGGQYDKMEEIYEQLKRRIGKPDAITFSGLIIGFAKAGSIEKSENAFNHMQEEGIPITTTLADLLAELFAFGKKFDKMQRVMTLAEKTPGASCSARMYGFAVQSYAQSGRVHDMEETMDKMFNSRKLFTSVKALESVIACYASYNNFEGLAMVLERIRSMGWVYVPSTYHTLLFEYGSRRELGRMEEVFKEMEDNADVQPTEETFGILADSYRGAGDEVGLKKTIDKMSAAGFKTKEVMDAKLDRSWTDAEIFDGATR